MLLLTAASVTLGIIITTADRRHKTKHPMRPSLKLRSLEPQHYEKSNHQAVTPAMTSVASPAEK